MNQNLHFIEISSLIEPLASQCTNDDCCDPKQKCEDNPDICMSGHVKKDDFNTKMCDGILCIFDDML